MLKISPVQIHVVAPHDGLKKKANKNMRKTVAMPTGLDFSPSDPPGVSVTTAAAVKIGRAHV